MTELSRRQFIVTAAAVGGGMALGVVSADAAFLGPEPWAANDALPGTELSAWISIGPDDIITVRVATPEIGNGAMTQTPMTIAEELNCDWSKMRAEYAPPSRDFRENEVYSPGDNPGNYFSGRSTSDERMKLLLQVGASARERLKAAAAQIWKVPVAEVVAKDSILTHLPTGRTLRYGEVAAQAARVKLDVEPSPKSQSEWTLLGKATPTKLNNPKIVDGSLIYGMDVRLPNMVYAALRQSPVHGGTLKRFDAEKARAMPGVLAVVTVDPAEPRGIALKTRAPFGYGDTKVRAAVAVIAEHYWQARKALDAIQIEWDDGAGAQWRSTEQMVDAAIAALDRPSEKIERASGDASLIDKADKIVEGVYVTPFSDQAPMEPLNSTAMYTPERLDVWHPGQQVRQCFWVAADEAMLDPSKVFYHQTFIGGAFGRRIFGDDLRMAVAIAKKFPGRPVHTVARGADPPGQVPTAGRHQDPGRARQDRDADSVHRPSGDQGPFPPLCRHTLCTGCHPECAGRRQRTALPCPDRGLSRAGL